MVLKRIRTSPLRIRLFLPSSHQSLTSGLPGCKCRVTYCSSARNSEFDGVLALKILQDFMIDTIEFRGSLRTEIVSERDAAFTWEQQFNIELRTHVLWSVLAEIFGV